MAGQHGDVATGQAKSLENRRCFPPLLGKAAADDLQVQEVAPYFRRSQNPPRNEIRVSLCRHAQSVSGRSVSADLAQDIAPAREHVEPTFRIRLQSSAALPRAHAGSRLSSGLRLVLVCFLEFNFEVQQLQPLRTTAFQRLGHFRADAKPLMTRAWVFHWLENAGHMRICDVLHLLCESATHAAGSIG